MPIQKRWSDSTPTEAPKVALRKLKEVPPPAENMPPSKVAPRDVDEARKEVARREGKLVESGPHGVEPSS